MACIQVLLDINAYASPKKMRMEGENDHTGASKLFENGRLVYGSGMIEMLFILVQTRKY